MITTSAVLCAFVLGLPRSEYRTQYPFPSVTAPSGWGVNIHFTDPAPGEIQKIAAAGFKWIRMDFTWAAVEKEKGKYDFAAYDRLMSALKPVGIRPLCILCYGNDLYEHGSPRTAEARAAFCRFVDAGVRHFEHRGVIWEMWNEPNIGFWQPKPNVDEYIALATEVGRTIRRAAPDEWFVGPGVSGFDWAFLQKCIDSGLLSYWDAVSTHPYRGAEPETVTEDWRRLRHMIDSKAPRGKSIPMISSEWGYSDISNGIGKERQGAFAARQYLTNLTSGVPVSILYDWKNDGNSTTDPESNFGTVTPDLEPKPSYDAIKRVAAQFDGFTFKCGLEQESDQDFALAFQRGKAVKFAAWTTSRTPHSVQLHLGPDSQKLTLTETPQILAATKPALVSSLSPMPAFVSLDGSPSNLSLVMKLVKRQAAAICSDPQFRTVFGIKGVPVTYATGSDRDIRKLATQILANWSTDPKRLNVSEVSSGGLSLTREVDFINTKPVSIDLALAGGHPWAVIHNPGLRRFAGQATWPGQPPNAKAAFASSGAPEQICPIGTNNVFPSGKTLSVRLGSEENSGPGQAGITMSGVTMLPFDRFSAGASTDLDDSRFALTQDGDPKVSADMECHSIQVKDGPLTGVEGVRIDYRFHPGWKFIELHARGDFARPIEGRPEALNMFVKGNGSNDSLRMRFVDSTGQTFQPDFGSLNWEGWRFVSFKLDGRGAGHWGGPDDGVVRFPIRVETLALIDSARNSFEPRSISIAGITLIGRK